MLLYLPEFQDVPDNNHHYIICVDMCIMSSLIRSSRPLPFTPFLESSSSQMFQSKKKTVQQKRREVGVSTRLKNMLVKLDHFPQVGIKIKRKPPPRQRSQKIVKPTKCRPHGVENHVLYPPKFAS